MVTNPFLDVCPLCGQAVALLPNPIRSWLPGRVGDHLFTGDVPSVWLRPGEPCPAAGADPETWDDQEPYRRPVYGEPGWLDDLFGGGRYRRPGRALAEHRYTLDVATGGQPTGTSEEFWPLVYGPPG